MSKKRNRRSFIQSAAMAVTASGILIRSSNAAGQISANDRINVGVIGLGSRGYNLIDAVIQQDDCRIVAVCDVDVFHYRDRKWGEGTKFGRIPATKKIEAAYAKKLGRDSYAGVGATEDFRELIANKEIDAVIVATPDHWHALCTIHALRAEKDVYCEKPVTHTFREGQLVYKEVAKHKAVFQTGSQQRSDAIFRHAVELVRNGVLGQVQTVEVGLPLGYEKPMGSTDVIKTPKQLNYDFWCGPSEVLPYMRARHHRWWRGHRAYGGGVLMDWIGHHNDIGHWAIDMDNSGPTTVEAIGWTYPETDVYNTPHHYTIRSEYEGGIVSTISTKNRGGLKLIGDHGWVWVNRGKIEASNPRWIAKGFVPGHKKVYESDHHMRNFIDCVRSRESCIAPAQTGHRSITPGHLGYVSNELGRKLKWDAVRERIVGDERANELLNEVSFREPWSL